MNLLQVSTTSTILLNSLLAICVVFSALTLLVFAFLLTSNLTKKSAFKRVKRLAKANNILHVKSSDISANEIAAISMALHLFFEDVHDKESNVITIKQLKRRFSPWNSKNFHLISNNYRR
jgi:hypothetical protein